MSLPQRLIDGYGAFTSGRLQSEQDRYREQFWAAFDAFVPGTPLF
jgi:hypothetical protein